MRPDWPLACEPREFCTNDSSLTPPADSGLVRLDSKGKFRVDEAAYFGCTDPEAVLEKTADVNIFELKCTADDTWATDWDKCYVEPVCENLPDPEVHPTK